MIRAVTFDAGGTIVHGWSQPEAGFAEVCRRAGVALPPAGAREGARAWKRHMRDQRELPGPDDWLAADAAALRAAGFDGDVDAAVARIEAAIPDMPAEWVLDPDVPAVLDALAGLGLRLGVVSNFDGTLEARLREWGLRSRFRHVADSAVVGAAKPDPAIFAAALEGLGVAPGECLHVGDRPDTDVAGALAAGVRPVLYDPLDCGPIPGGHRRVRRLLDLVGLL